MISPSFKLNPILKKWQNTDSKMKFLKTPRNELIIHEKLCELLKCSNLCKKYPRSIHLNYTVHIIYFYRSNASNFSNIQWIHMQKACHLIVTKKVDSMKSLFFPVSDIKSGVWKNPVVMDILLYSDRSKIEWICSSYHTDITGKHYF